MTELKTHDLVPPTGCGGVGYELKPVHDELGGWIGLALGRDVLGVPELLLIGCRFGLASTLPGLALLIDGALEQELDLAVDAAELVRGPAVHLFPQLGADPEQEFLALGHDAFLGVQRTGVDDG